MKRQKFNDPKLEAAIQELESVWFKVGGFGKKFHRKDCQLTSGKAPSCECAEPVQ